MGKCDAWGYRQRRAAQGFSIIEAMICVAIAAIGMLGVAVGQIKNMQYTINSLDYTMAVLEASNAIDEVWNNLCAFEKNPSLFGSRHPEPQNDYFTMTYPNGFNIENFVVVVAWSDERIENNLANRVEMKMTFPDITSTCKL